MGRPIFGHFDTVDPGINDDADSGFPVGTDWFNTATKIWHKSVADGMGAADWKPTADTTHEDGDGSDHAFIDQLVTTSASPTFVGATLTDITLGSVLFAGTSGVITQDNLNLFWDNINNRLGVGTSAPNAAMEVVGPPSPSTGGFASGHLQVRSSATVVNSNSVITGHSSFNGNTQLWYLGSVSSSNNNIGIINRQNGSLSFSTNNITRLTITSAGALSTPGDLDLTTGTGGVFKFTDNAFRAGLDAVEYVEMGHGGGNGFINAVGDGGLDFRFEGATLATFTDFGHLHLLTNSDQKHTLKIITADNLNDTGIAWENSGGSFTHTIFRTDVGTNRADLVFAAGQNVDIDLLIDSFKIHGAAASEGRLEVLSVFQISSGVPGVNKVLTSDATGVATWEVPSLGTAVFAQLSSSVDQIPGSTTPVVITYNTQDGIQGLTHSTTVDSGEITIPTGKNGVYQIAPQAQVGKDSGATKIDLNMFLQLDTGSGFVDISSSNRKLSIKDQDVTDAMMSVTKIRLNDGDKIRVMQAVSAVGFGIGLKNTDPQGTPTIPRTPSICFAMSKIGEL